MQFLSKRNQVIIHCGFCHTGTTSLQENLFSMRPDIFYCGAPLDVIGGTAIKSINESIFSLSAVKELCKRNVWSKVKRNQSIVLSDESLTDQAENFFTPVMMPSSLIANRLKQLFPNAKILFTIRDQIKYASSSYLNLKRNYAYLDQRPIEDFNTWFKNNNMPKYNLFLRNINYADVIKEYIKVFGQKSITIVPIEVIKHHGIEEYLNQIAQCLGINIKDDDLNRYATVKNKRLTQLDEKIINEWSRNGCQEDLSVVENRTRIGKTLNTCTNDSEPVVINLTDQQRKIIENRVSLGNKYLSNTFELPLKEYGYVVSN